MPAPLPSTRPPTPTRTRAWTRSSSLPADVTRLSTTCVRPPNARLTAQDFPELFRPIRTSTGYRDYGKIYSDEPTLHEGDSKAYEHYGISKQSGALVVARPDQHVALVCPLDDHSTLAAFFDSFSKASPGKPSLGKYNFPSRPAKTQGVQAQNGVTSGTGAL